MQFHWKVLIWMVAGVLVGLGMQRFLDAPAWSGARWSAAPGGVELVAAGGPSRGLEPGALYDRVVRHRGTRAQEVLPLAAPEDVAAAVAAAQNGEVLWFVRADDAELNAPQAVALAMEPDSPRARWIAPFAFAADIFLALLKMLIVPLIFASIVSGVASVGTMKDLRRMGLKTFTYYMGTSLLAVLLGQTLVNLIRPGDGAELGLSAAAAVGDREENFADILRRMVPENVVSAMTQNGAMLQVIFFSLLLGYFITRAAEPRAGCATSSRASST